MELIAIGDIHLDGLSNVFSNHLELQEIEIRKPLDYAIRHGIKTVVFLGDIFHSWKPSPHAVSTFYRLCADYHTLDIHIILGNHDMSDNELHSMLPLQELIDLRKYKNVTLYDKPTRVEWEDINVNFLPFPHSATLDIKNPAITFAHVERHGAIRDNGMRVKSSVGQKDKDFWVVGHLHSHQELDNAYYVGTPYQTKFGEIGEKGFLHLKASGKDSLKYKTKFVPTQPNFSFTQLLIESRHDFSMIKDSPNHVYSITLSGVKLPLNFLLKHPNVLHVKGEVKESANQSKETVGFIADYGLGDWLLEQGYDDKRVDALLKLDASIVV